MPNCIRCDRQADREVTWPFNGAAEFYCADCMAEYHAGADDIDQHEERLCAEGLPGYACPRPSERLLEPRSLARTATCR